MSINNHAVIRAWAKAQGLDVPGRGPLPKRIVDAYWAAYDDQPLTQP